MYNWGAKSLNDPCALPLRFRTKEQADKHAEGMNNMIHTWNDNVNGLWNKDHWKVKPQEWVVFPL